MGRHGLGNTVADQAQAGKREYTRGEAMARFTFTETTLPAASRSPRRGAPGAMGFSRPYGMSTRPVLADPDVSAGPQGSLHDRPGGRHRGRGMLGASTGLTIGKCSGGRPTEALERVQSLRGARASLSAVGIGVDGVVDVLRHTAFGRLG